MPRPFWHSLVPDLYYRSIYDIDLPALRRKGITGLVLDLDNTITAWRFGQPEPRLAQWVEGAKALGFRPYIVSNDLGPRVDLFTRYLGIPGVARAGKPGRRAFRNAVRHLELAPAQVAVVGDQIFTDVFGSKPVGCYTILVVPITRRDFLGTRLVRLAERAVLRFLARRGLLAGPMAGPEGARAPGLEESARGRTKPPT